MTFPGIEIIVIQIDRGINLSHHTEIIHKIKIHDKTIEVVHLNIKDKLIKYN